MELGIYQAVKDVAMQSNNSAWMLMDGGKIEVVQIDTENSKALWRTERSSGGSSSDWMHFSRFSKCFKRINQ
jgi:anti-sigma factor ChrR (cupin superfamily)